MCDIHVIYFSLHVFGDMHAECDCICLSVCMQRPEVEVQPPPWSLLDLMHRVLVSQSHLELADRANFLTSLLWDHLSLSFEDGVTGRFNMPPRHLCLLLKIQTQAPLPSL